ncbi:MAG: hypothetical protein IIX86_08075, partial [Clostridia bacterium]|nr:hypothetical protein [Clostridia bacterium]
GVEELFRAMQRLHEEGADCTLDILGSYEEDYADPIRRCEQQGCVTGEQSPALRKNSRGTCRDCSCFQSAEITHSVRYT